jgi:hypothetical protein
MAKIADTPPECAAVPEFAPAPLPANECARLDALRALNLLDSPEEERFDRITRLVAWLFRVPVAYLSIHLGQPSSRVPFSNWSIQASTPS